MGTSGLGVREPTEWLRGSRERRRAHSLAGSEALGLVMDWLYSSIVLDFSAEIRSAVPSTPPHPRPPTPAPHPLSPPQTLYSCPLGLQPGVPLGQLSQRRPRIVLPH